MLTRPTIGDDSPEAASDIESLIDELAMLTDEGMGYSSTQTGGGFLPLGVSSTWTLIFAPPAPTASDTMREIVSRGAEAIPHLIDHLDDDRPTRLPPPRGTMLFLDEYDVNVRTTDRPEMVVEPFGLQPRIEDFPRTHTVTVGDLCFVALGQIVNRHFNAVRYQPTLIVMVNSPTRSEQLRDAILDEWEGLTPDGHRASLIRDFLQPDHEGRLIGACLRLGYYYPELLEPLAVTQLSRPRYDAYVMHDIVRSQLYPAADFVERRKLFDAVVVEHGEAMREAIRWKLFADLHTQVDSPARECLVDLYGYLDDVDASSRHGEFPISDGLQGRLIETLVLFPTEDIDAAVRDVMHGTNDEYLALSCAAYFTGRGADAEIQQFVDERWEAVDEASRKRLQLVRDRMGWTPLHLAAHDRNAYRAMQLMDEGADVNALAANGQTPLHVASEGGAYFVAQALLERGAARSIRDALDRTPLDLAQDSSTVHLLLPGLAEESSIHAAALEGQHVLVSYFLNVDSKLVEARLSWQGLTPLHLAVQQNQQQTVHVLLERDADVNAADDWGRTPLHVAAACDSEAMVELLLANGADPTAIDAAGRTPSDVAREAWQTQNQGILESLSR